MEVETEGLEAFIVLEGTGVFRVDISDTSSPVLTGHQPARYAASRVAIAGGTVLMSESSAGVTLVESDRMNTITPVLGSAEAFPYDSEHRRRVLSVEGALAHMGIDNFGLYTFDISDPSNPVRVGEYPVASGQVLDLESSGGFVYVATLNDGVEIVDMTHPSQPVFAGRLDAPLQASRVIRSGDTLAVLDTAGNDAVRLYDISDPGSPVPMGPELVDPDLSDRNLTFENDTLYVLSRETFLDRRGVRRVIDLSDPSRPISQNFLMEEYLDQITISNGIL